MSKRGSGSRLDAAGKRPGKASALQASGIGPADTPMGHFEAADKLPDEEDDSIARRRLAYEQAVRVLGECVETISVATHEGVFRDAAAFLATHCEDNAVSAMNDPVSTIDSPIKPDAVTYGPESLRMIPAVVMYAGLNLSDQEALFAQVVAFLRSNCSSNIVTISSKDAVEIDTIMARIIAACKHSAAETLAHSNEPAVPPTPSRKHTKSKPNVMKSKLRSVVAAAQRKQAGSSGDKDVMTEPAAEASFPVLVFPDAQDVPTSALETLILAVSHLPVKCGILFGVCATVEGFRSQLSFAAASRLWIRPLFMKNPVVFVDALLETLCARSCLRVQIGLKPLQWLTQHMLKSNMSTQAVVQALRVCLVQFYSSNPLSLLSLPATFAPPIAVPDAVAPPGCDPALWSSCYQLVATLPDKSLEFALSLPSVTPVVSSQLALTCAQSTLQGSQGNEAIDEDDKPEIDRIQAYSLRRLHLDALEAGVTGCFPVGFVSTACQRIKEVPLDVLQTMVLYWQQVLMSCKDSSGLVDAEVVMSLASDDVLTGLDAVIEAVERATSAPTAVASKPSSITSAAPQRTNAGGAYGGLKKRAAVLQTVAEPRADKDPLWFARDAASKWLQSFTKSAFASITRLPMHEAVHFDHVASIKKWFSPAPRVNVVQALAQPTNYLPTASQTALPDICRAYDFYQNADRMIDLYEWYCAFKGSIVGYIEPATSSGGKTSAKVKGGAGKRKPASTSLAKTVSEDEERVIQARFLTATKELTWMGLVKPVGRRQDVVARTVFGMDTWS